ncbi:MAG: amidohydrolase family protein [Phycisphaerae bacterium]|nr:amidohydrolase family protein [Phycisphaerae bacterium]
MGGVIDFHTHAFPDALAERAMERLEAQAQIRAHLDGRIGSLLAAMDRAGIEQSVVCCIATRPGQFDAILRWCGEIASERIVPFASVHPDDADVAGKIRAVRQAGLRGVKLHPYYQDFFADEARALPIYEAMCREGLIGVLHTGYDFAFERDERAGPRRVLKVIEAFADLKIVMSHLGGWQDWDAVEEAIIGKDIYVEISYSLDYLPPERVRRMILAHPAHYMLFGSDSPWGDAWRGIEQVKALKLGAERQELLLSSNARDLLGG